MSEKHLWLVYVALAGLSWGTYVPLIFYGGNEFGGKPGARLMAILCVGAAYFVIGVILPLIIFFSGGADWPAVTKSGVIFSSLAGVAGAVGALCVIFATKAAFASAKESGLPADSYKVFIAPLIFGLAPVINVVVSSFWHPQPGEPMHFEVHLPGWKLWVGIFLVGVGAALVLFSKEEAESSQKVSHGAMRTIQQPAASPETTYGRPGGDT